MLKHTPFDGSSKPFAIGLKPTDLSGWLEFDENFERYLKEKQRLYETVPDRVFVAEDGTEDAQAEVQHLVHDFIKENGSDLYQLDGATPKPLDITLPVNFEKLPILLQTALIIQEDLVIMRRDETGWRLVAASLSFPSSWDLREKFSKPLQEIHAPIPEFGPGTRNAWMIERIFDNLRVELPTERFNWSIYADDELFHGKPHHEKFTGIEGEKPSFIRVERQILRKLPETGDIVFSIGIYLDPISYLAKRDNKHELIDGFIKSLEEMTLPQLQYKSLDQDRDRLIADLKSFR